MGKKNIFRYAFCNIALENFSWPEQCEIIGNAGYTGVEIAPLTIIKEAVEEFDAGKRKRMVREMKNAGIECAGLHRMFGLPFTGLHFTTPDKHVRQRCINYLVKLIDFCGDIGGNTIVWGSPNQRGTINGITLHDALQYFADGLSKVADHAQQRDIEILIEPISTRDTDIVNTLADAVEIVEKINHPAISSMFDFHNTLDETEQSHELVRKYFDHIHHVHFQNMDGGLVTSDTIPREYIQVFEVLKDLNYQKWISVEVFDYSPGGKYIADESMKTFMQIEKIIG